MLHTDLRPCHLSPSFHKIPANHIHQWIGFVGKIYENLNRKPMGFYTFFTVKYRGFHGIPVNFPIIRAKAQRRHAVHQALIDLCNDLRQRQGKCETTLTST